MPIAKTFWGVALLMALAGAASAHSFSVALVSGDAGGADQLRSAVRGFLVASAENDGHSAETADGHLGGLDVFLSPFPDTLAAGITGLVAQTPDRFDLVVLLGDDANIKDLRGVAATTVVVTPGNLPAAAQRTGFAERYRARFGAAPDDAAARGYNAARRIDQAVRQSGDAAQSAALREALAASAGGIDWEAR